MPSPVEAMRAIVTVRWPLLESYALARQEGLAEPVGLVIDRRHAYAKELAAQLLLGQGSELLPQSVTCMERAVLAGLFAGAAPDLARLLRGTVDEPGRWLALLLTERGWLLSGTWQELMMAEELSQASKGRSGTR